MNDETTRWLVLITNLPGHNPKLRMRVWRALKGAGAGLLRDGVYLLPSSPESRQVFENRAAEINAGGGTAHILPVDSEAQTQFAAFRALFDRTEEYAELIGQLDAFKRRIPRLPETEGRQQFAALGRETSSIITRDFFPGKPRVQACTRGLPGKKSLVMMEDVSRPSAANCWRPSVSGSRGILRLNASSCPISSAYSSVRSNNARKAANCVCASLSTGRICAVPPPALISAARFSNTCRDSGELGS